MKIILETLNKIKANPKKEETVWQIDHSKDVIMPNVESVKARLNEEKGSLPSNRKLQVHECYNDELPENRKPCKILDES